MKRTFLVVAALAAWTVACPLPSGPCAGEQDCPPDQQCGPAGRCVSRLGLPLVSSQVSSGGSSSTGGPVSMRPFADWVIRDAPNLTNNDPDIATDANTGLQWLRVPVFGTYN